MAKWEADEEMFAVYDSESNDLIADVNAGNTDEVTLSRTRMIAAAPGMYEALKVAEWRGHLGEQFCPVCRRGFEEHKKDCLLANALAKADGKQAANG